MPRRQSLLFATVACALFLAPAIGRAAPETSPTITEQDGANAGGGPIAGTIDPNMSFPAHSFFDVFVEIELPGSGTIHDEGFEFDETSGDVPADVNITNNTGGTLTVLEADIVSESSPAADSAALQALDPDLGNLDTATILVPNGSTLRLFIPEPAPFLLLSGSLLGLAWLRRRR
jgi:hypothetical protein